MNSGTRDTGKEPASWARELADRGAGEILLTSIDRDGTMIEDAGYLAAMLAEEIAAFHSVLPALHVAQLGLLSTEPDGLYA